MENSEYKFQGDGLETTEKRLACVRFNEYVKNYNISSFSDLQLLEELVYRETLQSRTKKSIAEKQKKAEEKKDEEFNIPTYLVESLDTSTETIILLKERLGILRDIKDADEGFNYIQKLEEKFKVWEKENQASREVVCPHCSKLILLHIRTEAWEAQKHPLFKDKILYNEHLVKMFLENKITAEDVAKVLGTSPKYVEWLIEKWHQRKENENEKSL